MFSCNFVCYSLSKIESESWGPGRVFFGIIILVAGNFLSNLAKDAIASSENSQWLGTFARLDILFIFLALGLSTMGIGSKSLPSHLA